MVAKSKTKRKSFEKTVASEDHGKNKRRNINNRLNTDKAHDKSGDKIEEFDLTHLSPPVGFFFLFSIFLI